MKTKSRLGGGEFFFFTKMQKNDIVALRKAEGTLSKINIFWGIRPFSLLEVLFSSYSSFLHLNDSFLFLIVSAYWREKWDGLKQSA